MIESISSKSNLMEYNCYKEKKKHCNYFENSTGMITITNLNEGIEGRGIITEKQETVLFSNQINCKEHCIMIMNVGPY